MKVTLILVAILGLAASMPVDNLAPITDVNVRNNVFEELLLGILEELRETMVTGSEDIPVLDPLELDRLHLELDELLGLEGSHITVNDLEARHLSTFIIDDLSFVLTALITQRYTLDVEGHIPVIEVDCDKYDLSVNAAGIHIFGAGNAKLRLIEPRIKAKIEVSLGILGGISLTIRSADVIFLLGGFEPQISGLFGTTMTDDFVNAFLRNLVPELVEFFQADISEVINSIIEGIGTISIDLAREDLVAMLQAAENPQLPQINV